MHRTACVLLITGSGLSACGGSSDPAVDDAAPASRPDESITVGANGEPQRNLTATPRWRLDDRVRFTGSLNASSAVVSDVDGAAFGVFLIGTEGLDLPNGAYSGSALGFTHSLGGDGTYTITDQDGAIAALGDSPGARVIAFTVQAGTAVVNASGQVDSTRWEASNGVIEMVVDEQGRYHAFTDEPVPLVIEIESGDGIPDRPDNPVITIDNAYARAVP